jgi:tetratricopeptide (TPR) repeat protein
VPRVILVLPAVGFLIATAFVPAALALAAQNPPPGQSADPVYAPLEKAYEALRAKNYDSAIAGFKEAIVIAPERPSVRKDLAYVLLKVGETEAARDQFAEALRLDPGDDRTALEYAFLCYESVQTDQQIIARRIFDRLRKTEDRTVSATAASAFENIDRPLREGIGQWRKAVELSPGNFSGYETLARLLEQHDEPAAAAEQYARAWHLRPDRRGLLVDLGRTLKAADHSEDAKPATAGKAKTSNHDEDAMAALLAASRGAEPRVAEEAREILPKRYPYVYEFERALALDPTNIELRRELAYLHLEMLNRVEAAREFEMLLKDAPDDAAAAAELRLLRTKPVSPPGHDGDALRTPPPDSDTPANPADPAANPKSLGEKSLEKGYLKDALKYLQIAHEDDPLDFEVMLRLGWTYNLLNDDAQAIRWFDLAQSSPDPKTAAEAAKAYRNLQPAFERFRTTVWAFPMFSTRWHDAFAYAQVKTELRLPRWFAHPYASVRFIGDSEGAVNVANLGPQYLSERGVILALGASTVAWHGANVWFEAGEMLRYSPSPNDTGRLVPDYRGGVSFTKGIGGLLARGGHGLFAETNDDGIFVSRFGNDTLLYSQNRAGYALRSREKVGSLHAQVYWNGNGTVDVLRQYWANYAETGPGVRFRFEEWRVPLRFSVEALRGAYLVNQGNPRRPNFNDVRVGIWYAFTK